MKSLQQEGAGSERPPPSCPGFSELSGALSMRSVTQFCRTSRSRMPANKQFLASCQEPCIGKLVRAGHSVAVAFQNGSKERHLEEVIRVSLGADGEASRVVGDTADGAF